MGTVPEHHKMGSQVSSASAATMMAAAQHATVSSQMNNAQSRQIKPAKTPVSTTQAGATRRVSTPRLVRFPTLGPSSLQSEVSNFGTRVFQESFNTRVPGAPSTRTPSEAPSTRTVGSQTESVQTPPSGRVRPSANVSHTGHGPKTQPKMTEGEILALQTRARELVAERHIEMMMGFMGETML